VHDSFNARFTLLADRSANPVVIPKDLAYEIVSRKMEMTI